MKRYKPKGSLKNRNKYHYNSGRVYPHNSVLFTSILYSHSQSFVLLSFLYIYIYINCTFILILNLLLA